MAAQDEIFRLLKEAENLELTAREGDHTLYRSAADTFEKATALSEQHFGFLAEETLNLRERWAVSLRDAGELKKAIACNLKNFEWAFENLKQCLSKPANDTVSTLNAKQRHFDAQRRLAENYLADKQHDEAIRMYEVLMKPVVPRSVEQICKARVDLASALFESGTTRNIMEAVNMHIETLETAGQTLGKSHIETAKIKYNLGRELYDLKKYDDALQHFGELLEILLADECMARSAPNYQECIEDAEFSLLNCLAKIDRQERRAKRAGRKSRRKREEPTTKSAEPGSTQTGSLRQKEIKQPKPQADEEELDGKKTLANATDQEEARSGQGKEEKTEAVEEKKAKIRSNKLDRDHRDQLVREKSRKWISTAIYNVIEKWASNGITGLGPVSESMLPASARYSGVDSGSAVGSLCVLDAINGEALQRNLVTDRRRSAESARPNSTSDAMLEPPIRSRSVSDPIKCVARTESSLEWLQQARYSRNLAFKSDGNVPASGDVAALKHLESIEQIEQSRVDPVTDGVLAGRLAEPTVLSDQRTEQVGQPILPSTARLKPVAEQADSNSTVSAMIRAIESLWPWSQKRRRNRSEVLSVKTKPRCESRPKSAFGSMQSSNKAQALRRFSEPSMKIPDPISLINGREAWNSQSKSHSRSELRGDDRRERPKSSQSQYGTAPSSPRMNQLTEPLSSSSDSKTGQITLDLMTIPGETTARRPNLADKMENHIRPVMSTVPSMTQSSYEVPARKENATSPQVSCGIQAPILECPQRIMLGSSKIESNSQQDIVHEERSIDHPATSRDILAEAKPPTVTPSVPIVRAGISDTGTREQFVPGSWYQDFEESVPIQKLRKTRSSDQRDGDGGGLRVSRISTNHRRASSASFRRAEEQMTSASPKRNWTSQDEIKADNWFVDLRDHAHVLLDRYRDDSYKLRKAERTVKIAVLDSGVAKSPANGPVPPVMKGPRIKFGKQLSSSLPWNVDTKGHGTHAAGLILNVCPYADVYVYRVCEGNEPISRKFVADAIADAVDKKKVDIISMSLGWEENSDRDLRAAIEHARASNVLLFAASSNEGIRTKAGMAYPARALEVVAVDAADVYGNPSKFNPPQTREKTRFTALGEAVRSTYPLNLPSDDPEPGWTRMDGTSCATPIAAGIAGLVLEFSRQRPLCFDPSIEAHLKSVEGMGLILTRCLSRKFADNSPFNHLDSTMLFHCTKRYDDGGDWAEYLSPRFQAANNIVTRLREEFSSEIGMEMAKELAKEWRNRS